MCYNKKCSEKGALSGHVIQLRPQQANSASECSPLENIASRFLIFSCHHRLWQPDLQQCTNLDEKECKMSRERKNEKSPSEQEQERTNSFSSVQCKNISRNSEFANEEHAIWRWRRKCWGAQLHGTVSNIVLGRVVIVIYNKQFRPPSIISSARMQPGYLQQ
jgi:hypothetical protein